MTGRAKPQSAPTAGTDGAERRLRLRRLDDAVNQLVEAMRTASEPRREPVEGWSAREVLAHLTFWHESFARNVSAVAEGRTPEVLKGKYVDLNRRCLEEAQGLSTDELLVRLQVAHTTVRRHVLKPKVTLIPYRKGSRDYTPTEHLDLVYDHIRAHLRDLAQGRAGDRLEP